MTVRFACEKDIPRMLELLKQVGQVHHEIRPDLFRAGAQKYDEAALKQLLANPDRPIFAAEVDGKSYRAVTNVGTRPTVSGKGITVEPWLLDYAGDLYDREMTLEFYAFLRPERKFDSLEALKAEICRNAEQTRQLLKN